MNFMATCSPVVRSTASCTKPNVPLSKSRICISQTYVSVGVLILTFLVTLARSSFLLGRRGGRPVLPLRVAGLCYRCRSTLYKGPPDPFSGQAGSIRHRPAKEDQLTFWYFGWSSRGSSTEGGSCSVFMRCMYGNVPATAMC